MSILSQFCQISFVSKKGEILTAHHEKKFTSNFSSIIRGIQICGVILYGKLNSFREGSEMVNSPLKHKYIYKMYTMLNLYDFHLNQNRDRTNIHSSHTYIATHSHSVKRDI